MTVVEMPARASSRPNSAGPSRVVIRSLQIGMGWFPEQPGGLDRYYHELLRQLPLVGVDHRGLVAGTDRASRETCGTVSAFAPAGASLLERWRQERAAADKLLEEWQPQLVVAHFALYLLPVLRQIRHLPLVVHFHGPWADESEREGAGRLSVWMRRRIEKHAYRKAKAFIVLSEAFKRVLHIRYGVDRDKIHVVPGGVNLTKFRLPESRTDARQKLGWPTGRTIVLCVRRLASRMGLEDLIDAAERLRHEYPELLVLIAGDGRLREQLHARIREREAEQHVRLLGFIPDELLAYAYRAADMTIVPSAALEGFGLTAVESLAAGTPTLVAPVGGLPEVVRDLTAELVLPASGADAIAEGLSRVLAGQVCLPSDSECRHYAAQFDWPVIAARVKRIYDASLQ